MSDKAKRCWLYCRVDTYAGEAADMALESQELLLREYCADNGYLVEGETRVLENGLQLQRPGIQELIDAAARHRMDLVLVCNMNRISRVPKDIWLLRKALNKSGVALRSLVSGENTYTGSLQSVKR